MTDSYNTASGYDRLAQVIGYMSLRWSNIESVIHDICLHYAAWADEAFEGDGRAFDVLHVTLAAMDMRQTSAVAKTLIFMASTKIVPELYGRAEALLNYVDNELRPERNRFIHDSWEAAPYGPHGEPGSGFSRFQMGPRVFSSQSRTKAYGTFTTRHFAEVADLERFVEALDFAYEDLVDLDNYSAAAISAKEWPEEPPPPLPAEWKSLGHRGWQGRGTPQPRV